MRDELFRRGFRTNFWILVQVIRKHVFYKKKKLSKNLEINNSLRKSLHSYYLFYKNVFFRFCNFKIVVVQRQGLTENTIVMGSCIIRGILLYYFHFLALIKGLKIKYGIFKEPPYNEEWSVYELWSMG